MVGVVRAPLASVDANAQKTQNAKDVKDQLKAWNTSILLGRKNFYGGRKIYMVIKDYIISTVMRKRN
jgi:hypothetical protein